jgi:SseB protein C-terminal domain
MSPGNLKQDRIEHGSAIHLGSPKKPDVSLGKSLAESIAHVPEIREAHLPHCFVPNTMTQPAPVLVLVLDEICSTSEILKQQIGSELSHRLNTGVHLDIWFLSSGDTLLEGVRRTDCKIFSHTESGKRMILRPWSLWNRLRRRLARLWPST